RIVCRRSLPNNRCPPLWRFCLTHTLTCGGELTMVEKCVKNARTEPQPINRDALVDAVEHSGKVEIGGQLQRGKTEATDVEQAERPRIGAAAHRVRHDPRPLS